MEDNPPHLNCLLLPTPLGGLQAGEVGMLVMLDLHRLREGFAVKPSGSIAEDDAMGVRLGLVFGRECSMRLFRTQCGSSSPILQSHPTVPLEPILVRQDCR